MRQEETFDAGVSMDWKLMVTILGVVMVLEGIPWFLSPSAMKQVYLQMLTLSETRLRVMGLFFMMSGLLVVYWVRG